MIKITQKGDLKPTFNFLNRLQGQSHFKNLDRYGKMGVDALARATPVDTRQTSQSWEYKVTRSRGRVRIDWYNTNEEDGVSIAVLIQFGHGTGNGGYVVGRDFINPAMRPVFDRITEDMWREVTR